MISVNKNLISLRGTLALKLMREIPYDIHRKVHKIKNFETFDPYNMMSIDRIPEDRPTE